MTYFRAVEFLNQSWNPLVEVECRAMQEYTHELDPNDRYAHTLSESRKRKLEEAIETLFNNIQAKLNPEKYEEDVMKDWDRLQTECTTLSYKVFCQRIKKFPEKLYDLMDRMLALAAEIPYKSQSGIKCLKKDMTLLTQKFPPLLGTKDGTVFEQVKEERRFDKVLEVTHIDKINSLIHPKIAFFEKQFASQSTTRSQMKGLFSAMSAPVQRELCERGYKPPFYGYKLLVDLYKTLGAHPKNGNTVFRVYAPHAHSITLALTAFKRVEHSLAMQIQENGVWSVETSNAPQGRSYHLLITGREGEKPVKKIDPLGFRNLIHSSKPPIGHPERELLEDDHESIVHFIDERYPWSDAAWMANRAARHPSKRPMIIYEVHPLTWKLHPSGHPLNWRELAKELGNYCKNHGYNAVELMALFAHPQAISMGYQVTSFFAPNSHMGTWTDFQYFVDMLHNTGIAVIVDWVPAHFAIDSFSLTQFDGTCLFEDENPIFANHPTWGTKEFDFKKKFVRDFLASNVDFLLNVLHIDAIRVDAVTTMLRLNHDRKDHLRYSRKASDVNTEAKSFLKDLNAYVHATYPGVLMIAEESGGFPNLVRPPEERGEICKTGGVGFDFSWHFGFAGETLNYWKIPAHQRHRMQGYQAPFQVFLHTVFDVDGAPDGLPRGKYVSMLSHDDNCHEKKTVFGKMPGDTIEERHANARLCLAYLGLHAGGPILDFQGNETHQEIEWHAIVHQNAHLPLSQAKSSFCSYSDSLHMGAEKSKTDLNHIILNNPGFWDPSDAGIEWFHTDMTNAVLTFHRRGNGQQFACIFNTADRSFPEYEIALPTHIDARKLSKVNEVYNSDKKEYGGTGKVNTHIEILYNPLRIQLQLPALSAIVLEEIF